MLRFVWGNGSNSFPGGDSVKTFFIVSRLAAFPPVMSTVVIDFVNRIKFPSKEAGFCLMQTLVPFVWQVLRMFILNWSRHTNADPALVRLPQRFTVRH